MAASWKRIRKTVNTAVGAKDGARLSHLNATVQNKKKKNSETVSRVFKSTIISRRSRTSRKQKKSNLSLVGAVLFCSPLVRKVICHNWRLINSPADRLRLIIAEKKTTTKRKCSFGYRTDVHSKYLFSKQDKKKLYTHTHTNIYSYIYIYSLTAVTFPEQFRKPGTIWAGMLVDVRGEWGSTYR